MILSNPVEKEVAGQTSNGEDIMVPSRITPVILAGGAGTRLWPMSREQFPKQLLPLAGDRPMLEETLRRFADSVKFAPPLVITNDELRFSVAEQLRLSGVAGGSVILEPVARNTAPAVAAAALLAVNADPGAQLLVLASDHLIADVAGFLGHVETAAAAARDGRLVTFSIVPTRPETGYGYIRRGSPLDGHDGVFDVAAFVEKPTLERAKEFLAAGDTFWNSGMFQFTAQAYLAELERYAPQVCSAVRRAVADRKEDFDFLRLGSAAFAASPSISVDYAVMEHTTLAATIPCEIGWTDVGSWGELWNVGAKDADGNVLVGDTVVENARDCYIRSEHGLIAAVGIENLIVVATDDSVLVMGRERAQDIRQIIDRLRQAKRSELINHNHVRRPWGSFLSVHNGERFQVKQLTVKPGAKLSLQKHFHRAEHWVVVNGTALVTRDDQTFLVRENESVYIPLGSFHRLENPGKVPLNLIEVQSGGYLGEDDIVRVDDPYGRVDKAEVQK
jgi:mannose-1-phosphate guanylyltransferase/mannose-1-phosphate guanylyltransferase/mannose-6-phosphate isomerase